MLHYFSSVRSSSGSFVCTSRHITDHANLDTVGNLLILLLIFSRSATRKKKSVQPAALHECSFASSLLSSSKPNFFNLYWSVRRETPSSAAVRRRLPPCLFSALMIISLSADFIISRLSGLEAHSISSGR